ncbi:MAG: hypothetical protein P0111_16735 [Nitrospira sp.]|nr:hypothetical protein [Nitrospira sp.]
MLREWIIFALCLGVGGHIALGVMLHAPDLWPWSTAGFYGLLSGLLVYAVVQCGRLIWKMARRDSQVRSKERPDPFSW